jgi:hypothetical protein
VLIYLPSSGKFFASSYDHRCDICCVILACYYFQVVVIIIITSILYLWNTLNSYDGDMEDISLDKSGSDTFVRSTHYRLRFRQFC